MTKGELANKKKNRTQQNRADPLNGTRHLQCKHSTVMISVFSLSLFYRLFVAFFFLFTGKNIENRNKTRA